MATCKGNRRNFQNLVFASHPPSIFQHFDLAFRGANSSPEQPASLASNNSNTEKYSFKHKLAQPCNDIYVVSFVLSLHTFPYLSLPYTPIHITPRGCELLLPGYVSSCMALWLRSWIPPGKWTNSKKILGKK